MRKGLHEQRGGPSALGDWQLEVEEQQMAHEAEKRRSHAKARFFVGTPRNAWGGPAMSCQRIGPKPASLWLLLMLFICSQSLGYGWGPGRNKVAKDLLPPSTSHGLGLSVP